MSEILAKFVPANRYCERLSLVDFPVSWAGNPGRTPSAMIGQWPFWFGSEDGRVMFATEETIIGFVDRAATAAQVDVNGLAANGECIGVATREDVTFIWPKGNAAGKSAVLPCGVHDISPTRTGRFIASTGPKGLMIIETNEKAESTVMLTNDPSRPLNFYQSVVVNARDGDVIVSAIRRGGIAAGFIRPDDFSIKTIQPVKADVINVCTIGDNPAIAALTYDRTICLFHDILKDQDPPCFKFGAMKGVGYRILSRRGHIFVLTSEALYVLANLADRLLSGDPLAESKTQILAIPMEATDVNIATDKYLLAVLSDGSVLRVDIDALERDIPATAVVKENRIVTPVLRTDRQMLMGQTQLLQCA